jgi:hypothetical protein
MNNAIRVLLCAVFLFICLGFIYGPSFLEYKETPVRSDAVILFGGDNRTRGPEAEHLLRQNYARYLIIPLNGEIRKVMPDGSIKLVSSNGKPDGIPFHARKAQWYKQYYEDTHVELLETRRMMDGLGLHSALLVSSPYHMRRIRIIAGTVFSGKAYSFTCVPTTFERSFNTCDWADNYSRNIMIQELGKLCWFMLYQPVNGTTSFDSKS